VEQANRIGEFDIDSAGTIGYHAGHPADARMRAAAGARGYQLESRARRVEPGDFARFDLIVAMDDANYEELLEMDTGQGARLVRMCAYCTRHDESEVPDPYYGGPEGFEHVLNILEDACGNLLKRISDEK
jgi:protein-tyrosine phosphatase